MHLAEERRAVQECGLWMELYIASGMPNEFSQGDRMIDLGRTRTSISSLSPGTNTGFFGPRQFPLSFFPLTAPKSVSLSMIYDELMGSAPERITYPTVLRRPEKKKPRPRGLRNFKVPRPGILQGIFSCSTPLCLSTPYRSRAPHANCSTKPAQFCHVTSRYHERWFKDLVTLTSLRPRQKFASCFASLFEMSLSTANRIST